MLRVNFSSENLHTWDPGFVNVALVSIRGDKFARLQASLRKLLSERRGAIVTSVKIVSGTGLDTLPEIFFALGHLFQFGGSICLARNRRVREKDLDCNKDRAAERSEEHTSELQSRLHLVCRLLLEKKKKKNNKKNKE